MNNSIHFDTQKPFAHARGFCVFCRDFFRRGLPLADLDYFGQGFTLIFLFSEICDKI